MTDPISILLLAQYAASVIGFAFALFVVLRVLREHYTPSASIAWLMAIILVPWVGIPLYIIFAQRKLRWRKGEEKRIAFEPEPATNGDRTPSRTEQLLITAKMPPGRSGNAFKFITDGQEMHREVLALIDSAEHTLHAMTFILGRDPIGKEIVERLAARAREGIHVKFLLDGLGCIRTRGRFVNPLRKAGGQVGVFLPTYTSFRKWSANLRNHRKMIVADGKLALVGGMNLAAEYMGPDHDPARWIDSGALIAGPTVADLEVIFANDWEFATGVTIEPPDGLPLQECGDTIVQATASGPDVERDTLMEAIFSAVFGARKRVWIVTPYFVPDEGLLRALRLQARVGRDVRIILPKRSNHRLTDLARGRYLRALRRAGARIYLYPGKMLHAKHIVRDDDLVTVGSANFDLRSLLYNFEVLMFIYSRAEVAVVARWMEELMENCEEFDETEVGVVRETIEDASHLISPML